MNTKTAYQFLLDFGFVFSQVTDANNVTKWHVTFEGVLQDTSKYLGELIWQVMRNLGE
ncbi:hypothetical protein NVP1084O_239 [Vibrio phage 1.084.O._10N.261.49.F5]|nr:hypothetical protein NVP1084O_239 [Vibrio phage 1.084.O._10N.261.49.F5]